MRVKINRVRGGSMGDQRDYGLVTGSIWNHELEPDTNRVSDVLRPVPRDEANIEAERGETIVGDLDQDGTVEHSIVGGKRHFQGGTPLNVPDGSYVFSDYNKLKIRNKDILKGIFNYGGKGATPAQIAKRYELNKYKDILNDPEADPLDKKTAQLMLDNNMMKLAQLALVQEGMKGFPDGIPDIALPLLGSDIAQARPSQQEAPMMAMRGGLIKAQAGLYKSPYNQQQQDAYANHPAADNPLNYNEDVIYQQDPYMRAFETVTNTMSHPVSALTYAIDPRAKNQSFLSYLKNSPHDLDAPITYNPYLPFMGPAMVGDLINTGMELAPSLHPYQVGSEVKEEEDGLLDWMGNAAVNSAYQVAALAGAYKIAKHPKVQPIISKIGPYLGKIWERTIPAVNEIVPQINPATGKPYTKGLTTKKGTPYVSGPKAGRAVQLEVDAAKQVGIKPTLKKLLNSKNKKIAAAAGVALYLANVGQQMYSAQEEKNKIPTQPQTKPVVGTPQSLESAADSIGTLNYKRKQAAQQAAQQAARTNAVRTSPSPAVTRTSPPVTNTVRPSSSNKTLNATQGDPLGDWGEKKLGGSLQEFQKKGQFDIRDQKLQDRAKAQGVNLIRPPYFNYLENVGVQSPSQNPNNYTRNSEGVLVPKGGWTNPNTKISYNNIQDLIDYSNPYVNFEDYDTNTNDKQKGIDLWKKNIAGSDADREKAGRWFVDRTNAYNRSVLGDDAPLTIDTEVDDFYEPGSEFMNVQFAQKRPATPPATTPVADVSNNNNTQMEGIKAPDYSGSGYPSPWTDYSLVDYYTALSNAASVNRGPLPPYATYSPSVGRPTFLDPARAIAQQQGLTAQTQEQIGAMSDPTVARANMIAASAKSSPDIANIMSQYDNQNAQIANQFNQQATNTYNDASLKNIGLRDNYAERLTTRDQQYENAMRDARTKVAGSYKRGAVDAREWAGMNQTNPNYYYDQFGNIRFKPGYNPTKDASSSTSDSVAQMMKTYMNEYGLTAEQAAALIKAQFQRRSGVGASNPVDDIWN